MAGEVVHLVVITWSVVDEEELSVTAAAPTAMSAVGYVARDTEGAGYVSTGPSPHTHKYLNASNISGEKD